MFVPFFPDEPEKEEDEKASEVASRLMELADEIQLIPPNIESDCPENGEFLLLRFICIS